MKKTITLLIAALAITLSVLSQAVETVTSGLNTPLGMALNGNDLYIGQLGAGSISKINITQALPIPLTTVLTGLSRPTGLLVVGNYLYICAENNLPGTGSSVGRINLSVSNPSIEVVASNLNGTNLTQGFCRNGNDLYVSASSGTAALTGIYKLDLSAPFPQVATQIVSNFPCSGMAMKDDIIYVGYFNGDRLYKLDPSLPNPVPQMLVSGLSGPDGLVFNGNYLYMSEAIGTTIKRIDITQANPVPQNVVTGLAEPTYVVFDGVDMYFAEYAGGRVARVTINQPVFSGQPNVCTNSVPNNLGGASPTGGVYSGPGVTNNGDGVTFTFNPTVAGGVGNYTVTYTIGGGSATSTINVISAPTVSFTPPSSVTINSGVQVLNGSPSGGTYSGPGITGSNFDPAIAGVGVHSITYTYTGGNGCSGVVSATINVTSTCPPGNVTFSSQAELNQFIIDYPNCTEIVGNLWIEGNNITNLSSLQNITSVGGYLVVENNPALTNLNGLSAITTLGADLTIRGNASLTNVNGLNGLTTISGWLTIDDNTVLTDVSGLDGVNSGVGNLVILDNPILAVCDLPNFCTYLAGSGQRDISGNLGECIDEQAVVNACNAAPTCPLGDVELTTQAEINQFIIDYPNCTEIAGYLEVFGGVNSITNLNGLTNITKVQGYVKLNETQLQSLNGLHVTEIGAGLSIENNAQLINIDALAGLTVCNGPIGIISTVLANLNALSNLTAIDGDIVIWENPALTDISGLDNINPATISDVEGFGLYIVENPLLQLCNLPNFCTYLGNDTSTHPRTITDNAGDCITEQAVKIACTLSFDESDAASFKAYPNPVKDVLNITYIRNITNIAVINLVGQEVISKTVNSSGIQLDMSTLPTGSYFVKVTLGGMIKTVKVLKL